MDPTQVSGIYQDGEPAAPRSGQPAGVLSTWIDEQLRDIQSNQVARFKQLRGRLQSDAFEWDNALLCRAIQVLHEEANKLNFDSLRRRGLLQILRGPAGREAFVEQYRRIVDAARNVQSCATQLAGTYRTHTSGARRVIVELEMEHQAMAREVAQAVEWLAEMSEDLERRLDASGDNSTLELLRKRAAFHAEHLKALHALQEMAAAICVVGQNVLARRSSLLEQLKVNLEGFEKIWLRRLGNVAEHAGDGAGSVDKAEQAHAELVRRLDSTQAASEALQLEEHAIGLRLAAMRKELDDLGI